MYYLFSTFLLWVFLNFTAFLQMFSVESWWSYDTGGPRSNGKSLYGGIKGQWETGFLISFIFRWRRKFWETLFLQPETYCPWQNIDSGLIVSAQKNFFPSNFGKKIKEREQDQLSLGDRSIPINSLTFLIWHIKKLVVHSSIQCHW